MSGADINKVLLAVFSALLVVLLIGNVVNEVTHKHPLEANAYVVEVSSGGEAEREVEAAPVLESVTPLLASVDPSAGETLAKRRCATCHTFNAGGNNKQGPNLWAVVGKEKAAVDGFRYSDAMSEKGGVWSYDNLNAFLADPDGFIDGTKMNFAGFRKVEDRAAVIAYMRQQADSPAPLPAQ